MAEGCRKRYSFKRVDTDQSLRKERALTGERYRPSVVSCGHQILINQGTPNSLGRLTQQIPWGWGKSRGWGQMLRKQWSGCMSGQAARERHRGGRYEGAGMGRMEMSLERPLLWAHGSLSLHFLALRFSHEYLNQCWSHPLAPGTVSSWFSQFCSDAEVGQIHDVRSSVA